jgi:hypothetical protein
MELYAALKIADVMPDGYRYAKGTRDRGVSTFTAQQGAHGGVVFQINTLGEVKRSC